MFFRTFLLFTGLLVLLTTGASPSGRDVKPATFTIEECLVRVDFQWPSLIGPKRKKAIAKAILRALGVELRIGKFPPVFVDFDFGKWNFMILQYGDRCDEKLEMTLDLVGTSVAKAKFLRGSLDQGIPSSDLPKIKVLRDTIPRHKRIYDGPLWSDGEVFHGDAESFRLEREKGGRYSFEECKTQVDLKWHVTREQPEFPILPTLNTMIEQINLYMLYYKYPLILARYDVNCLIFSFYNHCENKEWFIRDIMENYQTVKLPDTSGVKGIKYPSYRISDVVLSKEDIDSFVFEFP